MLDAQQEEEEGHPEGAEEQLAGLRPFLAARGEGQGADRGTDPQGGHEEAEFPRVAAQVDLREDRDHDAVVDDEGAQQPDQDDGPQEGRDRGQVAEPRDDVLQVVPDPRRGGPPHRRVRPHDGQGPERRDEAQSVDEEAGSDADEADQQARHRRAQDPRQVEDGGVERDRVHEVLAADQLDDEGLPGRVVDGVHAPQQEGQCEDVPVAGDAAPHQPCQDQGEDHEHHLGREEDPALGVAVDQRARHEGQDHDGQPLHGAHDPELERTPGKPQHEPGLPDVLHPGPDQGDALAAPEDPEVPVGHRREGLTELQTGGPDIHGFTRPSA